MDLNKLETQQKKKNTDTQTLLYKMMNIELVNV